MVVTPPARYSRGKLYAISPNDPVPDRIKHVIVHAHQPRNYVVAVQIEHLRVFRHIRRRRIAHRFDLPVAENDGLILSRRRSCSVNHSHVSQSDHRAHLL